MSESDRQPARGEAQQIVEAICGALPTSRHATMFFDMVRGNLGEDALVVTAAGQTQQWLFRREPSGSGAVVPHPLLGLNTKGRTGLVVPLVGPAEPLPRSGEAPTLRNLGPAEINLHDGAQGFTLLYGDDGRWIEPSHSASLAWFRGVNPSLARGGANPVDLLARWVAGIDVARHGPGRVLYPVPLPGGVAGAWNVGSWAIRDALFDGRLPEDAGWVVADGYAGTALVWGATRDEALRAWRVEVERAQPVRPEPPPLPELDASEGVHALDAGPHGIGFEVTVRGAGADVEWPVPAPDNTPAVVIPIEATPTEAHRVGSWTRLLGKQGDTVFVLRREDAGGLTLVGDRVASVVDLDAIDRQLDAVTEPDSPPPPPGVERPAYDCTWATYRLVDETTGESVEPRRSGRGWGWGLSGRQLDGDTLRGCVLRQRWLQPGDPDGS